MNILQRKRGAAILLYVFLVCLPFVSHAGFAVNVKDGFTDLTCRWLDWLCPIIVENPSNLPLPPVAQKPTDIPPPPFPPVPAQIVSEEDFQKLELAVALEHEERTKAAKTTTTAQPQVQTLQNVYPTNVVEKYFTIYSTTPSDGAYAEFEALKAVVDKHVNSTHYKSSGGGSGATTFAELSGALTVTDATSLQGVTANTLTLSGALAGTAGSFTTLGVGTTSPSDVLAVDGPVYLADTTAPTNTTARLYNIAGDLYWNGSTLSASTTGNWTGNGTDVYRLTGGVAIGTSTVNGHALNVYTSGNDGLRIITAGTNNFNTTLFAQSTGAPQAFIVRGSGNVGIGETNPDALLEVSASGGASDLFMLSSDDDSDGDLFIVDNSGNVGIGTTSPGAKLDVRGDILTETSATGGFYFGDGDTGFYELTDDQVIFSNASAYLRGNAGGSFFLYSGASSDTVPSIGPDQGDRDTGIGADGADTLAFITGGVQRVHIDNGGNIGIGTTTPTELLHVAGDFRVEGALYDNANSAGTNGYVLQSDGSGVNWVATSSLGITGGGASTFIALTDTPSSFSANRISFTDTGATALTDSADLTFDGINLGVGASNGIAIGGNRILYASTTNFSTLVGNGAGTSLLGSSVSNTAIGYQALYTATSSVYNTAIGHGALRNTTEGGRNTAQGYLALYGNTTGSYNTGLGYQALYSATTADNNTAVGYQALRTNTTGGSNVAFGTDALYSNISGSNNIAIGYQSLYVATSSQQNTAVGYEALNAATLSYNTALGYQAGYGSATSSNSNQLTAVGHQAAYQNSGRFTSALGLAAAYQNTGDSVAAFGYAAASGNTGNYVSAFGRSAGFQNSGGRLTAVGYGAAYQNTSDYTTAIGYQALRYRSATSSVAVGYQSGYGGDATRRGITNSTFLGYRSGYNITTGSNNLFLGYAAGDLTTSGSDNIIIGYNAEATSATASNELNIGNTIYGDLSTGYVGIGTTTPNKLLTLSSGVVYQTTGLDDDGLHFSRTVNGDYNASITRADTSTASSVGIDYDANLAAAHNFKMAGTLIASIGTTAGTVDTSGILSVDNISRISNINGLANNPLTILSDDAVANPDGIIFNRSNRTASGNNAISVFQYDGTERVRITTSGNVGIGTASPNAKLTVHGDINISDNAGGYQIDGNRVLYASSTNRAALVGIGAGDSLLTDGMRNTALGHNALTAATSSNNNTAVGFLSLSSNTSATDNTAVGTYSLTSNTTGSDNTALGGATLQFNTSGGQNTAVGLSSLTYNTTGSNNTALGYASLFNNASGGSNIAIGTQALRLAVSGDYNIAIGNSAGYDLISATSTGRNTLIGYNTGRGITTGVNNTILGANVGGLSATLSNNIILADGAGNQRLNIDSSGNVGIGTTTPTSNFYIEGETGKNSLATPIFSIDRAANRPLSIYHSDDTTGGFWTLDTNDAIALQVDGLAGNGLYVNANGYVGVGTTSPTEQLTVSASTSVTTNKEIAEFTRHGGSSAGSAYVTVSNSQNSNNALRIGVNSGGSGPFEDGTTYGDVFIKQYATSYSGDYGNIKFITGDNSSHDVAMTIGAGDQKGNIGIGTQNPDYLLSVVDATSTTTAYKAWFGRNATLEGLGIAVDDAGTILRTVQDESGTDVHKLEFDIETGASGTHYYGWNFNGSETVRFTSQGRVGIGTTSPTHELSVVGTIHASGTINSTDLLGGTIGVSVDANGNLIRTPSDERLKENIQDIDNALDTVLALRGVTYNWRDEERFGHQTEMGFIAQEVIEELPEVVRTEGEYWSLNTQNILAVVIEGMKEMWGTVTGNQEKIETLEERIEALEAVLDVEVPPTDNEEEDENSSGGSSNSGGGSSDDDDSETETGTEDGEVATSTPETTASSTPEGAEDEESTDENSSTTPEVAEDEPGEEDTEETESETVEESATNEGGDEDSEETVESTDTEEDVEETQEETSELTEEDPEE